MDWHLKLLGVSLVAAAVMVPVIGSAFCLMAGWATLARRYPDNSDPAIAKFELGGAQVGPINLKWPMKIDACPVGMRVAIGRYFFPLGRPFFVPWSEVHAQLKKAGLGYPWYAYDMARLVFGQPPVGSMVIPADTWAELAKAAGRDLIWTDHGVAGM